MAALGSIEVPIFTKFDDEYQQIGSISLDVHGELSDGKVVLSVEDVATALKRGVDVED